MELKEYQIRTLEQVKQYLRLLSEWRQKADENPELEIDFPAKAWEKAEIGRTYHVKKDGLGRPLPSFGLKIPTGGGKTFLAVKALDLINTVYRKRRGGLVLWIVPTNQIYQQTLKNLRNRDHPYRQHLDIASGGRTLIVEKTNRFTPQDIEENLVVMMLMLPSANRKTKETLRMFRDNGGFQQFFPSEDAIDDHSALLEQFPNLDTYGSKESFWGRQIKTSLGNTLRLLAPVIILDEGHKAYSEQAQQTLRDFNPSLILELSATPPDKSNALVDVPGIELAREEMIKLDLHVHNKSSPDWKDTLLASVERRNALEKKAKEYEENTSNYIRPICLVQVERTGRDQRGSRYIHSEDVREHLIKVEGIPPEKIAVTSAELKEIEGVDLLSRDCPIRYIITKQALQEGWDCSFAYVLTMLTNPTSRNALTQLVGRILRQPYARKTGVLPLDESYVYTFQQRAAELLKSVKSGFEREGLGDLAHRVIADDAEEELANHKHERTINVREKFRKAAKKVVLPVFVIQGENGWWPVNYDMDILSRISWEDVDVSALNDLALSDQSGVGVEVAVGLAEGTGEVIQARNVSTAEQEGFDADPVFLTRHLLDIVPNPWIAHEFGNAVLEMLLKKYSRQLIVRNFVFIVEELRKHLLVERDRLAKNVFLDLLKNGEAHFMVIGDDFGRLPQKIKITTASPRLNKLTGEPLQRSLFDYVPADDFNEMEKKVAWYLEDQQHLFFWYRNRARHDYAIQGWQKHKIYPDFIFTSDKDQKDGFDSIYVVETKGLHLKNDDTQYKKSVFDLCNQEAKKKKPDELPLGLKEKGIQFEVVYSDEWQQKLNEMLV